MNKKSIIKYIIFFIVMFICIFLFNLFRYDTIYTFGMSSSIAKGELPYKDINIIITPLYAFLMAIGLTIHNAFWVYLLEQAFLLTVFYYFMDKLFKKSTLIILSTMTFCHFDFIFPNYNFFIILLLLILLYCENIKKSDYIIGSVLAAIILTKQNIGVIIYLINIISSLSIKKAIKRTIPCMVGGVIFIIYLLANNTLYNFIDLSILGISSFANKNLLINFYVIPVIILFIYNIYFIYKNRKDKRVYYLIVTYLFIIPICNRFHVIYYLVSNLVIILSIKNPKLNLKLEHILIALMCVNVYYYSESIIQSSNYVITNNTMSGFLTNKKEKDKLDKITKKYKSYDKAQFISDDSMLLDLYGGNKVTYFDIPDHGNFGKDDVQGMIKKIKQDKGAYYFVDNKKYGFQFAFEMKEYIEQNYKKVGQVENFDIYYIE